MTNRRQIGWNISVGSPNIVPKNIFNISIQSEEERAVDLFLPILIGTGFFERTSFSGLAFNFCLGYENIESDVVYFDFLATMRTLCASIGVNQMELESALESNYGEFIAKYTWPVLRKLCEEYDLLQGSKILQCEQSVDLQFLNDKATEPERLTLEISIPSLTPDGQFDLDVSTTYISDIARVLEDSDLGFLEDTLMDEVHVIAVCSVGELDLAMDALNQIASELPEGTTFKVERLSGTFVLLQK